MPTQAELHKRNMAMFRDWVSGEYSAPSLKHKYHFSNVHNVYRNLRKVGRELYSKYSEKIAPPYRGSTMTEKEAKRLGKIISNWDCSTINVKP